MNMTIAELEPAQWQDVRRIYLEGIETGNATFETRAPSWEAWDQAHLRTCRFAVLVDGQVRGWVGLSPVSSRAAYAGVAEVSVYVDQVFRGKGLGRLLLMEAIRCSEERGIWTLQAGIFPENQASLKLHASLGFRVVGVRRKIGQMNGVWRDVALLERRSEVVGA